MRCLFGYCCLTVTFSFANTVQPNDKIITRHKTVEINFFFIQRISLKVKNAPTEADAIKTQTPIVAKPFSYCIEYLHTHAHMKEFAFFTKNQNVRKYAKIYIRKISYTYKI